MDFPQELHNLEDFSDQRLELLKAINVPSIDPFDHLSQSFQV